VLEQPALEIGFERVFYAPRQRRAADRLLAAAIDSELRDGRDGSEVRVHV
jgi:hypothetical protein